MALLKNGFLLCDLTENSIFGITSSTNNSNVIITQNNRRVKVYHIVDQKLVHDWSAKTGQLLTCPAVESASGLQFSVVIDGQLQRTWLQDDLSIDKGHKTKLSKPAHQLFVIEDTLVTLYADGSLGTSDKLICEIGDRLKIVWCDSLAANGKNYIVAVFQRTSVTKFFVRTYSISSGLDTATVETASILQQRGKDKVRSFCLQTSDVDDSVFLVILDDNGALHRILITPLDRQTKGKIEVLAALPVVAAVKGGLAMTAIDSTQLVVVSPANRNDQTLGLGLWDTKFGIFHSWTPLPSVKKSNIIARSSSGHLVLPCSDAIYVYPFVAKKATLLSSIGKLMPVTRPDERGGVPLAMCKTLQMLTQPSETPNYSSFKASFVVLREWLSECSIEKKLKASPALKALIQRCVTEEQFFPVEELIQLIQARVVASSWSLQLCAAFAAHKEINGLLACLASIKDLSESSLVTALSCFISLDDSHFAAIEVGSGTNVESEEIKLCDGPAAVFSQQKAHCINRVLVLDYNSSRLLQALHQLDYSHALDLIRHLEYLLNTTSVTAPKELSNSPSIVQIVDWLSLLIDAHYPQMVLSSDLSGLHSKLHSALQLQRQDIENLDDINKSVLRIVRSKKDSGKKHVGSYCITVLRMR